MDALEQLEQKISKALNLVEKLTIENKSLREENKLLSTELDKIKVELNSAEIEKNEQADRIKGKLGSIMDKLDQLEEVAR